MFILPWSPLLIFALIACNLLPFCFAWFNEPKALRLELFSALFIAGFTFLTLSFIQAMGFSRAGIVIPEGFGPFVLAVSLICGVFYLLESGLLFFLTPRFATLRVAIFALSVSFFSAVLVCGFTTFSPLVVLLHATALLAVVAWYIFGNAVGLIAALLIEGTLFGYGFIAPPLAEAEEFLPYVRSAAEILLFQLLVAYCIATRYRTLLTAGAALVPVYYWFVLYKAQQFGPYELLVAAAYGSCLILIAQWTKAPLLAFAGSVSLFLSLAAALHSYLTVEMTVAALTSFSILFCGLTLICTILYFGMILMHQRRTFVGYLPIKRAVGGTVLILLFLTIRMYGIFAAHYYALFTHLRSSISSILSFFRAKDTTQLVDSAIYRTWFLIGYDALWGFLLTLGGKAYQRLFVQAFGLVLLSVALYKLSLIVSHRGILAAVLLAWVLVVVALYRAFRGK